jgi:hypothetical protein
MQPRALLLQRLRFLFPVASFHFSLISLYTLVYFSLRVPSHSRDWTSLYIQAALYSVYRRSHTCCVARARPFHCHRCLVPLASFVSLSISFVSFISLSFPLPLLLPFHLFRLYATYYISTLVAFRKLYKPLYFTQK